MADGDGGGIDRRVPGRVFLGVGAFVGVLAALYAATAYEEAGTAMLALAAGLSLWAGSYLWLQQRPVPTTEAEVETETVGLYLPHASPWPLAIAVGAFLALNGLVIGGWFWFPGATVLAIGIAGFARQSRHRT